MKNILYCLSLLLVLKFSEGQIVGNTLNSCFYARYYSVIGGIPITSIQITGTDENNLAQCCEKCRAFPNCNLWSYFNNVCYFYSSFTNLTSTPITTNSYVGKRTGTAFWSCDEQTGKYYFEASLNWVRQTGGSSVFNRAGCCQDCFWEKGSVSGCKSYMYNEISRDCYHTRVDFSGSLSINYDGMFTGSAIWNINSFI